MKLPEKLDERILRWSDRLERSSLVINSGKVMAVVLVLMYIVMIFS